MFFVAKKVFLTKQIIPDYLPENHIESALCVILKTKSKKLVFKNGTVLELLVALQKYSISLFQNLKFPT
ncbi:hypothetical protein EFY79_13005 [Hanamia caeni]|uniref:Uncharacterized protein n=1 Tax=Hanamia caeni TaxID=2294116 RepID=A0A3M9NBP4_9BACT|nr:hypothetical protein EFY79_13005 [Hanamia caeni]